MKIWLADPGPSRFGKSVRAALAGHETVRLQGATLAQGSSLLPVRWQPDLLLFFPNNLGELPQDLGSFSPPCPVVLVLPCYARDGGGLDPETAALFDAVVTDRPGVRALGPPAQELPCAGYRPDLHRPETSEQVWDVGHPGPPPGDPWALARVAREAPPHWRTCGQAWLNEAQAAAFMASTRITLSCGEDPELHVQAPACGSLLLVPRGQPGLGVAYTRHNLLEQLRSLLEDEPTRARLAAEQRKAVREQTWEACWNRLLEELLGQGPELCLARRFRNPDELWWPRQVYRSQSRARRAPALALLRRLPPSPEASNLRACLAATLADHEPDPDRQEDLRNEALEHFEQARPLGRLALLSLAGLCLRMQQPDEAATHLAECLSGGVGLREVPFYPLVSGRFTRWWHSRPRWRRRLLDWKCWLLLAEVCPPFSLRFARLATRRFPQEAEGWWQRALRESSRPRVQRRCLRRVLRLEPLRMEARFALIRLALQRGNRLRAEGLIAEAERVLAAFPYLERERRDLARLAEEAASLPEPSPR